MFTIKRKNSKDNEPKKYFVIYEDPVLNLKYDVFDKEKKLVYFFKKSDAEEFIDRIKKYIIDHLFCEVKIVELLK